MSWETRQTSTQSICETRTWQSRKDGRERSQEGYHLTKGVAKGKGADGLKCFVHDVAHRTTSPK